MMSKQMPFGIPVKSMDYFPNQLQLILYWHNIKANTITKRTYAGVPNTVGAKLYYMQEAKAIQAYISKEIKSKYTVIEVKKV